MNCYYISVINVSLHSHLQIVRLYNVDCHHIHISHHSHIFHHSIISHITSINAHALWRQAVENLTNFRNDSSSSIVECQLHCNILPSVMFKWHWKNILLTNIMYKPQTNLLGTSSTSVITTICLIKEQNMKYSIICKMKDESIA